MKELVNEGELKSIVKNKMKYDKTKSYSTSQIVQSVPQIAESVTLEAEPIPPVSDPTSEVPESKKDSGTLESKPESQPPLTVVPDPDRFGAPDVVAPQPKKMRASLSRGFNNLIKWGEEKRGSIFILRGKQFAAIKKMYDAGLGPKEIQNRWYDLENDDFWNDKDIDFMAVASSFDRKR